MAIAEGGAPRGGRGRRRRSVPMSAINVTPMVDVMLVLLVIFMVTAPLLTAGVQVDLPESAAGPVKGEDEPLAVSVTADGRLYVQETEVSLDALPARLAAIGREKPDLRIFVRGDKGIAYGRVMEVMGAIDEAGFRKIALLTEMGESALGEKARRSAAGRDGTGNDRAAKTGRDGAR